MPDTPPPAAPSPEGVDPLIRQAHDFAELVESGRELVPWNYGDIAYVLRTLATRLSVPAVAPEGREAGVLVETLRRRVPLTEEINQWEGDDIDFTWWQASATGYNEALDAVLAALRTPPPVPPSGGVSEAMVERAAIELAKRQWGEDDEQWEWGSLPPGIRAEHRKDARAILESASGGHP